MTTLASSLSIIFFLAVAHAKPPQKIVGGTFATTGEFPSIVSLRINSVHVCAGAILDELHVLTAATCVVSRVTEPYENLVIAVGTKRTDRGMHHKAFKIFIPKNFDRTDPEPFNDIALIKLRSPIVFNNYVDKIELPTIVTSTGAVATTAGWGLTGVNNPDVSNDLVRLILNTVTASECQLYTERTISSRQLCAFAEHKGLCLGDGGNPLYRNNMLIGIASHNVGCGNSALDVFTSVYHYNDWIKKLMSPEIDFSSKMT